jgi:hypothetical protein
VYDTLLFLHVLAAFVLVASTVIFSAFALGGPVTRSGRISAMAMDGLGGLGTLVLGIWLALYLDEYEITDGWILGAIVLWALAASTSTAFSRALPDGDGAAAVLERAAIRNHWLRVAFTVGLLAVMVWKPGA